MGKNSSQRKWAFALFGTIALVYLVNLGIGSLPEGSRWQYAAGSSFLIVIGAVWAWVAGSPVTLRLDRARNTCRLENPRHFFAARAVESFPLERVRGVRVYEIALISIDGANGTGYEVRLETENGRAASFSVEKSRRVADRVARRIRDFLKSGSERLTMRRFPWIMLAVSGGLVLCGALLILSAAVGWPWSL